MQATKTAKLNKQQKAVRNADSMIAWLKNQVQLTARDFVYVYEPGIGQTYQNGPYLIGVGRNTYSCNYRGQCFSWGLTDFLSAIEACAKHARDVERKLIPSAYTQRCAQEGK